MRSIPNDLLADHEYLNESGSTLDDADPDSVFFDFDLVEGANVVKVKVTAEDGTTPRPTPSGSGARKPTFSSATSGNFKHGRMH